MIAKFRKPYKSPRMEVDAADVVETALLFRTVIVAKYGQPEFLKRLAKMMNKLRAEYEGQMTPEQIAGIVAEVQKRFKVKKKSRIKL